MSLHRHPDSPLLDNCPETLPALAYYDEAWFQKEQRAIWAKNWINVGRANDLPTGTMRRVQIAGQNLILCKDRDGQVTAFHNTCRHRGAELCSHEEQAMGKLITCKYHNWSYASDGRLMSTAHATPTEDFDKSSHGLFRVALQVWNGFLFCCLADEPPPLTPDMGLSALDHWPMANLVTGHRLVKEMACNWKIFWENYNECLHCPSVHPELCDMVPIYSKGIMSSREMTDWTPDTPRGQVLKDGAVTWSADGKACGPEFSGLSAEERANGFNFVTLYPTMFVVGHVDYVRSVTLMPLGPEATRLTAEWYFPPETLDQPGFSAEAVSGFATMVMTQDAEVCELNQRGLKSSKYQSGRLMPQEFDIHNFHRWVMRQLGEEATQ
jgi:glycine betaine catabolism A